MTTTTTTTTTPSTHERSGARTDDLHLLSVLESGLPAQLGTVDEPATYTVPIVVSRQVTPGERARLEDPETARRLAVRTGTRQNGESLRLVVSDRRLLIENTTLDELRDGLADALSTMLQEMGDDLRSESSDRAAVAQSRAVEEQRRVAAVHAAVAAIHFE
ncbi:hypothetical protein Cch01nite_10400 [Cellulomonas chitinilytica]|uniref:Uncharacterized protein n=1 Tax=Cellulomonas chitinilytica TaxID=398759 RepID=A0A919U0C6_9CELL|nr:hypothetical protein [Cellulomonas chitinilytica]GIG20316.1 hypothetical protein Cch01nite_10400 [Cellulomonas chitinilytica]